MTSLEEKLDEHIKIETKRLDELSSDVKLIMSNHLQHVQASLTELDVKMKGVLWFMGALGGAIIVNFFKK